jgi:hypothetical protein
MLVRAAKEPPLEAVAVPVAHTVTAEALVRTRPRRRRRRAVQSVQDVAVVA